MNAEKSRPPLTAELSAPEFRRWYWLKTELVDFARLLSLRSTGGKQLLTERIAAALAGAEFTEPTARPAPPSQLSGELSAATVIPVGQRCSQVVRTWFTAQVGAGFRFDEPMREYFRQADGTATLGDALAHWHRSRGTRPAEIGAQFAFNRFARSWHAKNPGGTRDQLLSEWQAYRSRPVDRRR